MEPSDSNIYDGCEFDENQNIDWDALEITEELALQIGGPSLASPTHNLKEKDKEIVKGVSGLKESKKHNRDFRFEEEDETEESENIKFMRFGSLGRIIASSVVASTPPASSDVKLPYSFSAPDDAQRCLAIKCIATRFIDAFNLGDMGRLALLVRELCDESCLLVTPDVDSRDCIVGRADVMMLFSLILETFPDGVYRTLSSAAEYDRVTVTYSFTGTRVFEQSMDSLYKQCRMHAAVGTVEGTMNSNSNPESFACELDLIQISKTTTQNIVSVDLLPKASCPSSSDRLHAVNNMSGMGNLNSMNKPMGQYQQHNHQQQQYQHQPQQQHFNPFQTLQHKFQETVVNLMPHAGRLASEALKEGPIKRKRSMEMHFNSLNQVVKIVFIDIAPTIR